VKVATTKTATSRTSEQLLCLYRAMVRIRCFETWVEDLYSRAEIPGIAHVSSGQEAVAVGVCEALELDDYITSTHRGHGHCLAKGASADRMFAELLGKSDGYCRGRGGSMHIADPATGNLGANAIVGGSLAIATGAALSASLRRTQQVVACFIGDGALNQGLLLESMNMAALWGLPAIYVCEHNRYGEYTPADLSTAGDIRLRGEAFGVPTTVVDGMDVIAVNDAAGAAVERARSGAGPSFLICETYRFSGHGMSDRDRSYRTREEEAEWLERDPIERLNRFLVSGALVPEGELDAVRLEAEAEMTAAVEFARQASEPSIEEVRRFVYAD
jgi:TPP-dependent pyruvate/acetoin dehydrogenase alpha subunit